MTIEGAVPAAQMTDMIPRADAEAMVAAALEKAATGGVYSYATQSVQPVPDPWRSCIRNMITADQRAALDSLIAAAEAAALERAADRLPHCGACGGSDAIIDLITPEAASALEAVKAQVRRDAVKVKPLDAVQKIIAIVKEECWKDREMKLADRIEARIRAALEGGE